MNGRAVAILVAAGRGERLGAGLLKPLRVIGGLTLLERSLATFVAHPAIDGVVVALPPALVENPPGYLVSQPKPVLIVAGGNRRQDSVAHAFAATADEVELLVIHDAARPFVTAELITRTIEAARESGAALAALPARDTVKIVARGAGGPRDPERAHVVETLDRRHVVLAQTPQAFLRRVLRDAFAHSDTGAEATDEAGLAECAGHAVRVVDGDPFNIKITVPEDLVVADAIARLRDSGEELGVTMPASTRQLRIGNGYDNHRLVEGRPLVLGGVRIPFERGLLGHSDADAICHAVTDAVLGAASAGDIGRHFPDSDPRFAGASSLELLRLASEIVRGGGGRIVNVDVTLIAERPKIGPYVDAMRANLSVALGISANCVSVKGKTNEGVDAVGRGEAMAAHAVALVELS